jgi:hypothetical protein
MEVKNDPREAYKTHCLQLAKNYNVEVSDHILNIMVSVCMTRDEKWVGGSFVQSVVNNDLFDAISRADKECLENLRIITLACRFCPIIKD